MQPYSARFPQEIVDEITDDVHDTRTLRACTLVSHAWSSRPYTRLWQSVHITSGDASSNSTFCNLLRASLRFRSTIVIMEVTASGWSGSLLHSEPFATLLDLLPNLHTLRLVGIHLNVVGWNYVRWNRQTPLRELALSSYKYDRPSHLMAFLAFFAKVPVEKLAIDHIFLAYDPWDGDEEDAPFISQDAGPFLDWKVGEFIYTLSSASITLDVLRVSQLRHLRSLDLGRFHSASIHNRFVKLAEAVGEHLTSLRINIVSPFEDSVECDMTTTWKALSHLTALKRLELDWQDYEEAEFPGRQNWPPIYAESFTRHADVLQHVSPSVRYLVFRFVRHAWSHFLSMDTSEEDASSGDGVPTVSYFAHLEQKLLSLQNLQVLAIMQHDPALNVAFPFRFRKDEPLSADDMETVKGLLPALNRSGKLQFSVDGLLE